jgi:ChrB-like protein
MVERTSWVFLAYRLPREPSTPRISLWRKLKRLGVAQLLDGLVALPLDARNREQLEWLAEEVVQAGGSSSIWEAKPTTVRQERELVSEMQSIIAAEYRKVVDDAAIAASAAPAPQRRSLARLRAELGRIRGRDYFPPAERDHAHAAVEELATAVANS